MRITSARRRRTTIAGLLALSLLAAACGGGDDDEGAAKKKSTSAAEEATTTTVLDESTTTSELAAATTSTTAVRSAPVAARKTTQAVSASKQSSGIANVAAAPTTVPQANIKRGGTLTFGARSEVTGGWDPAAANTAGVQLRAVFDTLVEADTSGNVVPRLAESVSSTDGITWILKIRSNVKFSDGTPFDAAAVMFNWKRVQDPATKSPGLALFNTWQSYEQTDPLTIKIVLKSAIGQFPRSLQAQLGYIGSPTAMRDMGSFTNKPVGAGAFTLKSWKRDDTLELERNPNFWDAPRPYVDKVIMKQLPDITQRYNSLKTGAIDCGTFSEDPTIFEQAPKDGMVAGLVYDLIGGRAMSFNTTKAPFNDVRARRAIAYMLDREGMNKALYKGVAQQAVNLIGKASPFHDANIKLPAFDAARAQQNLDEWSADNGGKDLTFTILSSQATQITGEFLQAQSQAFKKVKIELKTFQSSQAGQIIATGDFELFNGTAGGGTDPDSLYTLHTGQVAQQKYSNPEMDKALDTGRSALDLPTRYAAYQQVQRIVADQVPFFVTVNVPVGMIAKKEARNCEVSITFAFAQPDLNLVWLDR